MGKKVVDGLLLPKTDAIRFIQNERQAMKKSDLVLDREGKANDV